MKKYKANYIKGRQIDICDYIHCEVCGSTAVDIHHITHKSQGGSDEYENLIALCRGCHNKAHNKAGCKEFQSRLKDIAKNR